MLPTTQSAVKLSTVAHSFAFCLGRVLVPSVQNLSHCCPSTGHNDGSIDDISIGTPSHSENFDIGTCHAVIFSPLGIYEL